MRVPTLKPEDRVVSMPDETLEFDIVRDTDALQALQDDWQRLWQASAPGFYVMGFPVVWQSWKRVLEPEGNRLHVVVGRLGGRAVLILPIMVQPKKFHGIWGVASWVGRDSIDYGEALIEPSAERDSWIRAALKFLASSAAADFLALESVRSDANVFPVLDQVCRWRVADDPAPYIDLSGLSDGDALEAKLPKRFRQSIRRRARRLEEVGAVCFEFAHDPEWLEDTIQWIIARKREWIDERDIEEGHGLTDAHAAATIDTVRGGADGKHALVSRLTVDGKIIAADVSLISSGRLYSDFGSFDLEWGKFSPGSLLLRETIKWAIDNGIEIFDFARGPDEYKTKWGDGQIELTRFLVPCTMRGRLYVMLRTSPLHKWFRWAKAKIKASGRDQANGDARPSDAPADQ